MVPRPLVAAVVACSLIIAGCDDGGDTSDVETRTPAGSAPVATITQVPTGVATASSPTVVAPPTWAPATPGRLGTPSDKVLPIRAPDFAPLAGAKAYFGTLGTAGYRIEVPDDWNGSLVMYAHGFRASGDDVYVSNPLGPLRQLFISQGFAWAASSYSENFYVPGIGADDTMDLLAKFEQNYGKPKRTFLVGESMGGNVVALLLEHFPQRFDGALAVCGALGGEEEIDYLASWAMVAEYVTGVTIPIGKGPAPMALALLTKVPQALGDPDAPTPAGERFRSVVRELTGGERPFFEEGFARNFTSNFALLILDPDRRTVAVAAATNEDVEYMIDDSLGVSEGDLNDGVRRLAASPLARDAVAHPDAVPTTGRIERPLLTLHNTGDVFVPITQEVAYRDKVEAAGKADLLVQRAIRDGGHCLFSDAEYTRAWNDLVGWVEDGTKPDGDDFSGDLRDIGRKFTDPLRPDDPGGR